MEEKIEINSNKGIKITKVWVADSWKYKVKKYSINLGFIWIPGWKEEKSNYTKVEYFNSLEEAKIYTNKIKDNYLNK